MATSTSRHHAEWLSLLEISGPFLSLPVLLRAFPQGLDTVDSEKLRTLRLGYEEWLENQSERRPDAALHTLWVRFVLESLLELPRAVILEGQAIPAALKAAIAEQGETLRPDLVIANPPGGSDAGKPRILIQVYPAGQDLDKPLPDWRWKASPATRMMELLHATEVRLGLVTDGERWMLVDAPRGETTGFASWYAEYWLEEPITLRAFRSLLGPGRLFGVAEADTLEALLAESAKDQQEVTDQLGYQVRRAVGVLVQALDRADQDRGRQLLAGLDEAQLYEAALTFMMRLVFLFSAEERGLLLLGDPLYDQFYAVSTLRAQLREAADQHGEEVLERRFDAWSRLLATFRAVFAGVQHENLRLPAYGGSLFHPDRFPFLEGRRPLTTWVETAAEPLPINNRVVLHLLEALQILRVKVPGGGPAEPRRLSFRALDIEQIGHVYEGLLDHTAVRAAEDVLGLAGTKDKEPEVALGEMERRSEVGNQRSEAFVAHLREITGRSELALRRALEQSSLLEALESSRLRVACANDDALYQRVLPFAGLLREDDFGLPVVIRAGSVYVTAGTDRRSSGTHYTPRSLTEPIVQHTLEPLVYIGPAEGLPREQWTLRTAAEILALKVCDMAMGSGAFLVQTCRYLAERLVEAWEKLEKDEGRKAKDGSMLSSVRITPDGKLSTGEPNELLIPVDPDERMAFARRIVADRCLYGVDKNPLAVEMAKLSLWLITLDRNRPFTFLDHALKCGDSLVGADEDMFLRWAHGLKDSAATLFDETLRQQLETARAKRRELESFEVREVRDAERKAALLAEAEAAMARVKLGCDLLIGTRLLGLQPRQVETRLNTLLMEYMAQERPKSTESREALEAARKVRAFHWPFEYPEVYEQGGFSAFVGNPPFAGGTKLEPLLGAGYRAYIVKYIAQDRRGMRGAADLCAYFFCRAGSLISEKGTIGLVATNTIAQGDTREIGLDWLVQSGLTIYRAIATRTWPGTAHLEVAHVWLTRGPWQGTHILDDRVVGSIDSLLTSSSGSVDPYQLEENTNQAFEGAKTIGMGFVLEPDEATALMRRSPMNSEVILPYIVGQDLNSRPDQSPSRYIVAFRDWPLDDADRPDGYDGPVAADFPDCLRILEERVKPERLSYPPDSAWNRAIRARWWQFALWRPALQNAIKALQKVMVRSRVSNLNSIAVVSSDIVFSDATIVFAFDDMAVFAILQSSLHTIWIERYASTMRNDVRYTPSSCFATFVRPPTSDLLKKVGTAYEAFRQLTEPWS